MPKITKRLVEATETRETGYILFDSELPGFGIRVLPSGSRYYIIQYNLGRKKRRVTIGKHGVLTAEKARRRALVLLAAVRQGGDPAGDRQAERNAITVAQLADDRTVVLSEDLDLEPYTGADEEHTHFAFDPGEAWGLRARVMAVRPRGEQVEITAVGEDAHVHEADRAV